MFVFLRYGECFVNFFSETLEDLCLTVYLKKEIAVEPGDIKVSLSLSIYISTHTHYEVCALYFSSSTSSL